MTNVVYILKIIYQISGILEVSRIFQIIEHFRVINLKTRLVMKFNKKKYIIKWKNSQWSRLYRGWLKRLILKKKSLEKSGRVCPLLFFAVIVQTLQSIGFTNRKINPSKVQKKTTRQTIVLTSTCWLVMVSQNTNSLFCSDFIHF